jgi:uncharacterized membrane protein YsdA (DUF1294 family)
MELIVEMYFVVINLIGYVLMYFDKRKAVKNKWRIPEKQIWIVAFLGGALGASIGMNQFRHKTQHPIFRWGLPILTMVYITIFLYFITTLS